MVHSTNEQGISENGNEGHIIILLSYCAIKHRIVEYFCQKLQIQSAPEIPKILYRYHILF